MAVIEQIEQAVVDRLANQAHKLRRMVLDLTYQGQCGHPGGSLSLAEIMSCMYFHVLRVDPKKPNWEDRDRLILSKGHAAPIYYAALAEVGFFPKEALATYGQLDSILQGHPDMHTPGVDMSSGSLGQGLSPAAGIAPTPAPTWTGRRCTQNGALARRRFFPVSTPRRHP